MSRRVRHNKGGEEISQKSFVFYILLGVTGVCWGLALLPELMTGKKTGASWEIFGALLLSACILIWLAVEILLMSKNDPKLFLKTQKKNAQRYRQMYPFIPSAFQIKVRPLGSYRWGAIIAIMAGVFLLLISFLMLMELVGNPLTITIPAY